MGSGTIVAILLIVIAIKAVFFLAPLAAVFWFLTRTSAGRRFLGREKAEPRPSLTLEVADQLRGLQAQLDDAHARLDFAERVMLEQREQLRALGAPEPHAELYEPTPV